MHHLSWKQNDVPRRALRLQVFSISNIGNPKRPGSHAQLLLQMFWPASASLGKLFHARSSHCSLLIWLPPQPPHPATQGFLQERHLRKEPIHKGGRSEAYSIRMGAAKPTALINTCCIPWCNILCVTADRHWAWCVTHVSLHEICSASISASW